MQANEFRRHPRDNCWCMFKVAEIRITIAGSYKKLLETYPLVTTARYSFKRLANFDNPLVTIACLYQKLLKSDNTLVTIAVSCRRCVNVAKK